MEQRTGSSSQPLQGAGFDPAFVPGLTSPASAEPEGGGRDGLGRTAGQETSERSSGRIPQGAPEDASEDVRGGTPQDDDAPVGGAVSQDAEEGTPDGPVFTASDRRARIVADHRGVRLALDDQDCEFRWDEIAAVETSTPRFGKRFTAVVYTPDRRWYPIEIEAPARSRFAEWEAQLDDVLDAYFDDGDEQSAEEPTDAPAPEPAEEPTEQSAEEPEKS